MSLADAALGARSAELFVRPEPGEAADGKRCPFPHQGTDLLPRDWLQHGLQCAAGKREFRLNRYFVARFTNGAEFAEALAEFREQAADHLKTGFLAIYAHDQRPRNVVEELALLGAAVRDAGLTDNADALIAGETLSHAIEVRCPVTGKDTAYEFFSVAFCKNSGNPKDPLYDPSLSAPFTAINTTSDAFAFARLVHDQSMRAFGRPVYEMTDNRDAIELLFRRCITAWQNMSVTTITNYSRVSVDPTRGVHLSEDRRQWYAAHNDPVFAELKKCPFVHEMPVTYAARLTAKWSANLFDGQPYVPSRDGQSGGIAISRAQLDRAFDVEGLSGELFEF